MPVLHKAVLRQRTSSPANTQPTWHRRVHSYTTRGRMAGTMADLLDSAAATHRLEPEAQHLIEVFSGCTAHSLYYILERSFVRPTTLLLLRRVLGRAQEYAAAHTAVFNLYDPVRTDNQRQVEPLRLASHSFWKPANNGPIIISLANSWRPGSVGQ